MCLESDVKRDSIGLRFGGALHVSEQKRVNRVEVSESVGDTNLMWSRSWSSLLVGIMYNVVSQESGRGHWALQIFHFLWWNLYGML